jgi:uncharacterized protein YjbI with pentapeptide repeats
VSEQQNQAITLQRPMTDDRGDWKAYWEAQGMSWRREPEIDEERKRYLAKRRAAQPNIEKGIYPFRDMNGRIKLVRADVEWLLATHVSNGKHGPVYWGHEKDKPVIERRRSIDLRGADLSDTDLAFLPLTGIQGGVDLFHWMVDNPNAYKQAEMAAISLSGANLLYAHLEGAILVHAQLSRTNLGYASLNSAMLYSANLAQARLFGAHLEGAGLIWANLVGAELADAYCSEATDLKGVQLCDGKECAAIANVFWSNTNLSVVDWSKVSILGDERGNYSGSRENAARAYRQLARALHSQGLNEDADRFAYKAQKLQRQVLWRQRRYGAAFGSWLLDIVAGYGYKPMRTLAVYLLSLISFAVAYFILGQAVGPHLSPLGAFVFSMTSFHGRGFFPGGIVLDDPITVLAAFEAFVGLVVEVSFIATFTQRFFAH